MSLTNTRTRLTGHLLEMPLSKEILGRVLNGMGRPIDGFGEIYPEFRRDVNGNAINPVSRRYPKDYIQTGISSIDCLTTLIRGQKLPIFLGMLPKEELDRVSESTLEEYYSANDDEEGLKLWT